MATPLRLDYSRSLRAVMSDRNVPSVALAEAVGVSKVTVRDYLSGRYLPRVRTAMRISEALGAPHLYDMLIRRREVACVYCGTAIVSGGGGSVRRWCNATCRDRFRNKRTPRVSAEAAAIAVMCRECEPGGGCYTVDCPLRPYSPLPLVDDTITPLARSRARRGELMKSA